MTQTVRGADAEGTSTATGMHAHAEGDTSRAAGHASHAEGNLGNAQGQYSHAEGNSGLSTGYASHVEGSNTRATGNYSHAEGDSTQATASGAHAEGLSTQATMDGAHAEGNLSQATGAQSHAEGDACRATAASAHAEGSDSWATAFFSHAEGSGARALRRAERAKASGFFSVAGDGQVTENIGRVITTDATPSRLTAAGTTPATVSGNLTNVLTVLASRAMVVQISVVARRSDVQGQMAGFTWRGLVGRDSTGNARIIGTPTTSAWADVGASLWTLTVAINTTDATGNYVEIIGTGEAGKTINWVAEIRATEVGT